jgi:hypothetical protein
MALACLLAAVTVAATALVCEPRAVLAQPQTTGRVQMPPSEIEIVSFRRHVDATNLVMGTTPGSTSSPSVPTITVAEGDTVLFKWVVKVRHASRASAAIKYGTRSIDLNLGTAQNEADDWKRYENQRNVTITEPGLYTMRVSGFPGGGSRSVAEKSIQVNVREAEISVRQPRVDPTTRRVTFVVRSTGDIPAEGRFTVRYQIQGRNPMRSLVESSLSTESMTVEPGHEVDLGHVDLPDTAQQSAQLWMRVAISLMGRATVPESSHDYTYDWPAHELRLRSSQLSALGQLLGGEILIHNYADPHAEHVKNIPYTQNASRITLLGKSFTFNFARILYSLAGVEHYFFVNSFRADLGGPEFLNIENGKLILRANFTCEPSDREVKGWTRDWVLKRYVDNTTPDVDIQRFNLKVELIPRLASGKLSYGDVTLSIDSAMRFPDGWAWLNGFKGWMNDEVQKSVRANFTSVLSDSTIKSTIENELANVLTLAASGSGGIHQIISVRGSGSEIIVSYR